MRKMSWIVPVVLVIAALACEGSVGSSVSNEAYTCSQAGGVGSCNGSIGSLSGSISKELDVGGSGPVPVNMNATVGEGTLRVSFEAADGSTVSADATPGNPAVLSAEVSPSDDVVAVTFEAVDGKVSGVAYSFEFGGSAPVEEPVVEEPAAGGEVGAVLVVNGTSATTVCYLFVSPSDAGDWGQDQLGEGTVVAPGDQFTLSNIPLDTYDLRADDCDGNTIAQEAALPLTAEGVTWTFTDE